ncbi:tetratricopeptide repeat protein [Clostridium sp.]|uniref:tetratricopeptide repeat protein n=1 Tax=Clostridium sp. TaxID=1506 RepID=UPI003D6D34C4
MKKWGMQKIVITSVLTLLVIIGVGFGGYKYAKINQYNGLIKDANRYMKNNEYDKAIDLYKQSLSYKNATNIENSIRLAQNLIEENKVYNEGIRLMNDKKYLESIDQFKMIGKDSNKLYTDAQNNINECNKEYVALNISKANIALESNNYDEANNYITQVFKIDNNNENAKNLKDTIDKKILEQQKTQNSKEEQEKAAQMAKEAQEKAAKAAAGNITTKSATDIVRKLVLEDSDSKTLSQFDHEETVDGVKYFVIHVYDVVVDHTATRGWYYVNQNNGKVFDGTYGDLIPMN